MRSLPELRTARLALRPLRADDLDTVHALLVLPDVRRYLCDDRVLTRDECAAIVQGALDDAAAHGWGLWVLSPPGHDDEVIGLCGLRSTDQAGTPEILYALHPSKMGRGFATEAARAVLRDAFTRLGLARVLGMTDPPNLDSRRVMDRLGFSPLPPRMGPAGTPQVCAELTAESWRRTQHA